MVNHFDEEFASWMLTTGVPQELLEYTYPHPRVGLPQVIVDRWFDASVHTEAFRRAARSGIGFWINPGLGFDLGVFGEDIECVPLLGLAGSESDFYGLERLPLARSLRLLQTPMLIRPIDLSGLAMLEVAHLNGPGSLSAATAPNLYSLGIERGVDVIDRRIALSPSIELLGLTAPRIDLKGLTDQVPLVEGLSIEGARRVDLSPLRALPRLSRLTIRNVRSLTGTAVFDSLVQLTELEFWGVANVDDIEAIERLTVEKLEAVGAPFGARFVENVRAKEVKVSLGRTGAGKVPWQRSPGEDGEVVLMLEDLSWVVDRLSDDFDAQSLSTYHVEQVLEKHLAKASPEIASTVQFDSEGSWVILIVNDPGQVSAVEHATDRLFAQKRFLREVEMIAKSMPTG